jgi:pyruvate dehydrogenase E2 component (dihydrolipoamide acetyltransferase)
VATPVIVPRESDLMEVCRIVEWYKKKGDAVKTGDLLCEVETEKATFDLEAPVEGVILDLFYEEDSEAPLLAPIAVIGEPGESYDVLWPGAEKSKEMVSGDTIQDADIVAREITDAEKQISEEAATLAPEKAECPPSGQPEKIGAAQRARPEKTDTSSGIQAEKIGVSPRAKKLAGEMGVSLSNIRGTGPDGHIVEKDVRSWISKNRVSTRDAVQMEGGAVTIIPLKSKKAAINNERLHQLQAAAQLTLHASASAEKLLAFRDRLKDGGKGSDAQEATIDEIVLFITARILKDYKSLNSHLLEDRILQFSEIHVGFAVDTQKGFLIPVIKKSDTLNLSALSQEVKRLTKACRDGFIDNEDLRGGTFTVSNLGVFGIESFTPVLKPPQVAILGVGNIQLKPVQKKNGFAVVPHIGFSLTINHQVADDACGARFLQSLVQTIEKFDENRLR